MLDLLVAGGQVVIADGPPLEANVGVQDGRIVGLYTWQDRPAAREVVDATGRVVLPGLIDPHVHPGVYLDLEEDLQAITRFALLGGITSMVAFHRPPEPYQEAVPAAQKLFADASHIDFGFILGVTQRHHIEQVPDAMRLGVGAFKFYLGYCGHEERFAADFPFTDAYLTRVFEALADAPGDPLLCVHCENAAISQHYQEALPDQAEQTLAFFERIHPVASEAAAAINVSLLGHLFDVRTCVVHVSAGTTAKLLAEAPWISKDRTVVETCPHYLAIDTGDPTGMRAVVRPPIRSADEVAGLWHQLLDGTIDTIGSDHCASDLDQKLGMDVWSCRVGFGEMGLTLPLLLSEGVHARGLSLQRLVALTSRNIAVAHGLHPRKGDIRPGADADLVVVDLEREAIVDADRLKGRREGSVYAGRELRGWPVATVAGGRLVCVDGQFVAEPRRARFLGAGD
jgi:dihydroorotase-like cyclic amidohydrolase